MTSFQIFFICQSSYYFSKRQVFSSMAHRTCCSYFPFSKTRLKIHHSNLTGPNLSKECWENLGWKSKVQLSMTNSFDNQRAFHHCLTTSERNQRLSHLHLNFSQCQIFSVLTISLYHLNEPLNLFCCDRLNQIFLLNQSTEAFQVSAKLYQFCVEELEKQQFFYHQFKNC